MLKNNKTKKFLLSVLIGVFVFVELFSLVLFASPASTVGFPVDIIADLPKQAESIVKSVKDSLTSVALGGLVKAVSTFMNKMAKDTAMYIASGGKGQGAMIFQDGPAAYFKKTALSSTSGLIDDYAGTLTKITGVDPNKISSMMTTLRSISSDPMAALKSGQLSEMASSLSPIPLDAGSLEKKYGLGGASQASLSFLQSIKNGGSLGTLTDLTKNIDQETAKKVAGASNERSGDTGMKAVTSLISGIIKTPASTIQEETKALTAKNQGDLNAQQVAGIYGNATLKTIPTAMMTFLSTLTSELMKKIMSGDWFDEAKKITTNYKNSSDSFYSQFIISNRNRAQASFSFLFTVPTREVNEYENIISELANCDPGADFVRGVNNCVIDDNFMNILLATKNEPMTIAEALSHSEYGKLFDKPFISPGRKSQNESVTCAEEGYCYYNMQKLRKLRIVPLGFEIAAKLANQDNPEEWKLSKVVAGFYDCDYTKNTNGERTTDKYPFCHLIDPNWILKVPSVRCESQVYGATLAQEGSNMRISECTDFSTKVSASAPNYYSYCTKEKNIWVLNAGTCDEQFSTCKTYTNKADNSDVSYLSRTLDFGTCDEQSVGCMAYSTEYDKKNDTWQSSAELDISKKILGRPGTIYFNNKITGNTCNKEDVGCNQFYKANLNTFGAYFSTGDQIYLKKAPDYLGCYDMDTESDVIEYPVTSVDLNNLTDKPQECSSSETNYAQLCIEDEVGCKNYLSMDNLSDNPAIPGVIGVNSCPAECVGYETYRQLETEFAPTEFPLYFIPSEADSCDQSDVGCDEFTNIDEQAKGGEELQYYTSLRRCELPTGENEKPFYSWQGSATEGYVLKIHRLLPIDASNADYIDKLSDLDSEVKASFLEGSPAYYDDYKESLEEKYALCNEIVYKADALPSNEDFCRALYDKEGNIHYRLLEYAVTVSESCQPLRKTESLVEVDEYINDQVKCEFKKGVWENDQCKRCYAGGEYKEGLCYYWTIPAESSRCSATANGCREYRGNNSNNIENIFFSDFEGGNVAGWNPLVSSSMYSAAESLRVGESSLGIKGSVDYSVDRDLNSVYWYQVSFWARGDSQNLAIKLTQGDNTIIDFTFDSINNLEKRVSVSSEWKYYKFGPVQIGEIGDGEIILAVSSDKSSSQYYLDNFALTEMKDSYFRIKNSWKKDYPDVWTGVSDVPYTCDDGPDDAYPGQALGCRQYVDQTTSDLDGTKVYSYTTGFEKLCRPEAVGCTAMYDTYNTISREMEVYNAECRVVVSDNHPIPQKCSVMVNDENYECDLVNGVRSCLISNRSILLPADFEFESCYSAGQGVLEFIFSLLGIDIEIKSDDMCIVPANVVVTTGDVENSYLAISDSTIIIPADTPEDSPLFLTYTASSKCGEGKMGCQELAQEEKIIENKDADVFAFPNKVFYLNNPSQYLGEEKGTLCSSETAGCGSFMNGNTTEYFKDPKVIGNVLCEYVESITDENNDSGWYMIGVGKCTGNQQLCTKDKDCGSDKCDIGDRVPCYEDYQKTDGSYGLWSNKSTNYRGLVGSCPSKQNGCIELVDPQAKSQYYPAGKPYYILDSGLSTMAGECNGQVNLVNGCVLFDRTDSPTKLYNSVETYIKNSEYNQVQKTKYRNVLPVTTGTRDANLILQVERDRECAEWLYCRTSVDEKDENGKTYQICPDYGVCRQMDENGNCLSPVSKTELGDKVFTKEDYFNRGVDWENWEYTGYTLLDKKHIINFDTTKVSNKEFVLTNDGTNVTTTAVCKAFPEQTAPFDPAIALKSPAKVLGSNASSPFARYIFGDDNIYTRYSGANICQTGDCGCSYMKVEYQDGVTNDYWPITSKDQIPPGVCTGTGSDNGKPCKVNEDCASLVCSLVEKKSSFYGTKGFCLEYDYSRPLSAKSRDNGDYPCTTWLPFDIRINNYDQYNMNQATGYAPGLDTSENNLGEVFCTESTQGYLYDSKNYGSYVDDSFNNYFLENIFCNRMDGNYCSFNKVGETELTYTDPKYFYTNLQRIMWNKIGSTATVLFSRIPLNIFAGYTLDYSHDPDGGFIFGKDDKSISNPDSKDWRKIYSEENYLENQRLQYLGDFGDDEDGSSLTFTLNEKYNIAIDDIRSLYLSPVVFKKKFIKTNYYYYDTEPGNADDSGDSDKRGFTVFENVKIDLETLKNVFESRKLGEDSYYSQENSFYMGAVNKNYPDFSKTNFVYLYGGYGNDEEGGNAHNFPVEDLHGDSDGTEFPGGGGMMHTFHFYGETNDYARAGLVIDISDPTEYYHDETKEWNTPCLLDEEKTDGENAGSIYDIIRKIMATYPVLDEIQSPCGENDSTCTVGNFTLNLRDGKTDDKSKYREYAVIVFNFPKNTTKNQYELENYRPYVGGQFREDHYKKDAKGAFDYNDNYGPKKFLYGLSMSVTADLKAKCTEFDVVHQDINSATDNQLNKAWTDRVWIEAQKANKANKTGLNLLGSLDDTREVNFNVYNSSKNSDNLFGILPNLDAKDIRNNVLDTLIGYYFNSPEFDGYPLTSFQPLSAQNKIGNNKLKILQNGKPYYSSLLTGLENDPYSEVVKYMSEKNSYPDEGFPTGKNILDFLFAESFIMSRRNVNDIYNYESITSDLDNSESLSIHNNLLPPQIYSLNTERCTGDATECVAYKKNDFTINNVGWNEEARVKEPIVAVGSYTAKAKFFVFADTNKMPIKSVKIDWGDKNPIYNDGITGFYANRKPYCQTEMHCKVGGVNGLDTQLTCKDDNDCLGILGGQCLKTNLNRVSFGDSARACKDEYYAVTYNYTCEVSDTNSVSWSGLGVLNKEEEKALAAKGYNSSTNAKYCVYKPKIQVTDNWGWCNGTCEDPDKGCYENECKNDPEAWTEYLGRIIIVAN